MSRPPVTGKRRDDRLELRVLPEERKAWDAAAKRAGIPLSEWIRRLLNAAVGR